MSCSTYIYKRVTTKEEALRLIKGALSEAKDNIEFYSMNPDILVDEDSKSMFNDFMEEVKQGKWIYDESVAFCRMSNGKWIYRFELTNDDIIEECNNVIAKCEEFLAKDHTFEEMKKFILDNYEYWGFDFSEPFSWDAEDSYNTDYDRYTIVKITDDEIYVHSTKIQHESFEKIPYFRVYGYPCDEQYEEPTYYQSAPAGKDVFGWSNAEDLIEFLEWWKDTKWGKNEDIEEPYVITTTHEMFKGYGDKLYSAIRNFFEVNKGKELLVHFG